MGLSAQLHGAWRQALGPQFELPYMQALEQFLQQQQLAGKTIYPAATDIFNPFNSTPMEATKVVILGQDPYHGPNQAHGLCFSVQNEVKVPPSLVNIFKELQRDMDLDMPSHGNLQSWAEQGVLLLNATLTVEQAKAGSHQGQGWEQFTDKVIELINDKRNGVVFMLWGSYAHKKGQMIDRQRHLVLESVHPSPLSAHRGFFGCGHFSQANAYLQKQGQAPIDWSVPEVQMGLF